jgi:hypothetical protein
MSSHTCSSGLSLISTLFNPLTLELNPSAQSCLPKFLLGILIFKGLTARRLYKSFGVKGLKAEKSFSVYQQIRRLSHTLDVILVGVLLGNI